MKTSDLAPCTFPSDDSLDFQPICGLQGWVSKCPRRRGGASGRLTKARPILPLPENGTPMVTLTMVRMMMGKMNTTSAM